MSIKSVFTTFLLCLIPFPIAAQALPIAIDGQFADWVASTATLEDVGDSGSNLDLLRMSVANDEKYLYLKFELSEELVLIDNNSLTLFIDGDNNQLTGKAVNGIGAELELRFSDLEGVFHTGSANFYLNFDEIGFHHLPNFSSNIFELAIGRNSIPNGTNPLFSGNEAKILLQNGASGDKMPNTGQTFTYAFDETPTPAYQAIDLPKQQAHHIRVVTWNTLYDGLLDTERRPHFKRIMAALQPDLVTFNECWDMTAGQAASFMNEAVPLGGFQSWNAAKLEAGNITVSRFPILENWAFYPNHRLVATLIDLPNNLYSKDFLLVNGHLRCCEANFERQLEADAFAKFVLDAKTPGGSIDLPEGTPIVLSGDMNLVGWQDQYTTLVTGQIINTNVFGNGGPLDWDGTDLQDVLALQADQRMAYTWHEEGNSYPPSRLDFHFCTNSVMQVAKAFILQTEIMPSQRLALYGLFANDNSIASDHLPAVTDFELDATNGTSQISPATLKFEISPNPTNAVVKAVWENPKAGHILFSIKKMDGGLVRQWVNYHPSNSTQESISLTELETGVYLLECTFPGEWKVAGQVVKL